MGRSRSSSQRGSRKRKLTYPLFEREWKMRGCSTCCHPMLSCPLFPGSILSLRIKKSSPEGQSAERSRRRWPPASCCKPSVPCVRDENNVSSRLSHQKMLQHTYSRRRLYLGYTCSSRPPFSKLPSLFFNNKAVSLFGRDRVRGKKWS